mgnify:CR=1 FL=1
MVFGVGVRDADIMFVGEGPGEQEDLQGEPFVGAAGKLLDDMNQRVSEIRNAGLEDEKIITDIIIDEFGNLSEGYSAFVKEKKKKQRIKIMKYAFPIGGFVALILIFAAYFSVSGITGAWDKTWLIIVGGIFAMIIFYFSFAINALSHMRKIFHPIARLLVFICIMLITVFTFLFWLMMLPDEALLWPVFPGGVILALITDLVFAYTTKQKFRTVSFFVYMPVIATMIYIILAAYHIIAWSSGLYVVLIGLGIDFVYIFSIITSNIKYFMYKQEAE